jgi:hypothetical protein
MTGRSRGLGHRGQTTLRIGTRQVGEASISGGWCSHLGCRGRLRLHGRKDDGSTSGGPTVVGDFLAAGLVDHMHLVQVPIVLVRGVRVWDSLEALEDAYDIEAVSSPNGVTHLTFTRKVAS